jgi:hypothetical protein
LAVSTALGAAKIDKKIYIAVLFAIFAQIFYFYDPADGCNIHTNKPSRY